MCQLNAWTNSFIIYLVSMLVSYGQDCWIISNGQWKLDVNREFLSLNQVATDENFLASVLKGTTAKLDWNQRCAPLLCIRSHAYQTVDNDGSIGIRWEHELCYKCTCTCIHFSRHCGGLLSWSTLFSHLTTNLPQVNSFCGYTLHLCLWTSKWCWHISFCFCLVSMRGFLARQNVW